VRCKGGQALYAESLVPRGDGVDALDDTDVMAKSKRLLGARVSEQRGDDLLDAVRTLPTSGVATLSDALKRVFD